jgi:hypothetical protein
MTIIATPMAMKARPAAAVRRDLLLRRLRHSKFQEQVEPPDQEAERHYRNGGADPGEKGALVGGVVAVTFDHWMPR